MRRMRVGGIVACGLATALLDVALALSLLGEVIRADGGGFLAWTALLVVSGCFLTAVAIVLLYCAAGWGWCWPGWGFGLFYPMLVAEELWSHSDAYGSPTPLVLVCSYLTTVPFQLAVWARHTATRPTTARRQTARHALPRHPAARQATARQATARRAAGRHTTAGPSRFRPAFWSRPAWQSWSRRVLPSRFRPGRRRAEWPHTVRRVFGGQQGDSQESRSATLAEESPSAHGWNSVANRR